MPLTENVPPLRQILVDVPPALLEAADMQIRFKRGLAGDEITMLKDLQANPLESLGVLALAAWKTGKLGPGKPVLFEVIQAAEELVFEYRCHERPGCDCGFGQPSDCGVHVPARFLEPKITTLQALLEKLKA